MAAPLRSRRLNRLTRRGGLSSAAALAWPVAATLAGLGWALAAALGLAGPSGTDGFGRLAGEPGLGWSIWLSLWMGPATAGLALAIVALILAGLHGSAGLARLTALMAPAMAIPHAAAGFALAFLIAPSGMLMRLVSPEISGFSRPPDWLIVNDPAGLSLFAGLVIKEVPFLFLMVLAVLPQADPRAAGRVAQSLGYRPGWAFLTAVFPGIYARVRFPAYAVVAFAGSVVDLALILGPGTPAPLAVRVLAWLNDPDFARRSVGAAGAILQLGVTLASLLIWRLGEIGVGRVWRNLASSGYRGPPELALRLIATVLGVVIAGCLIGGLALVGLWSIATRWPFPDALPSGLTNAHWIGQAYRLGQLAGTSLGLALASAGLSLGLAVVLLEASRRGGRAPLAGGNGLLMLPLLVPQVAFLAGLAVLMLGLGVDGTAPAVVAVHVVFVLPYLHLSLAGAWMRLDPRYERVALALGRSEVAVFWSVRVPMLAAPLLFAFAVGCAVSLSLYLPTLLIGGGRVVTLTTEAVALAAGGDRRLIGIYALCQTLLPALLLAVALLVPVVLGRWRRGLIEGASQ
jgi:putative thiamine transport system permease protein